MTPIIFTQRRWQLALVLMVTFFVGYLDRLNISFAVPLMAAEFNWSDAETRNYGSLLMGLFYAGFGLTNLLLTPLAVRLGPRRSLISIVLLWSLFTALGAWLSQWLALLMATRVLLGMSEGFHIPMVSLLMKTWFPLEERARANSLFVAGLFLAVLLAPIIMVPLMSFAGWRTGFLLIAAFGLFLSLPLVWLWVHDTPQLDRNIGDRELAFIASGRDRESVDEQPGVPLRQLLLTPGFLLLCLIGTINNIVALGFTSWIPTYFTNTRGIPFNEITWLVALPYLFALLGIGVWSWLGDRFNIRAALGGVGFAGAGISIYVALQASSIITVAIFFSAAVFMISAYNACEFAMVQRVMPLAKVAEAMGIYSGVTVLIGGGLGPLIVAPIIGAGGASWLISVVALANAGLLMAAWRVIRY